MKKTLYYTFGALALAAVSIIWTAPEQPAYKQRHSTPSEPHSKTWAQIDLKTGELNPTARSEAWKNFSSTRTTASRAGTLGFNFTNVGPDNVGGRTRAIIEVFGNPDRLIAGSVSGGLFISNDGGARWEPHTQFQNLDSSSSIISAIHQDTISGRIYVGTGCMFDDPWPGFGIYYSDDEGETFKHLSATTPANRLSTGDGWVYVNRIRTDGNGVVYAATYGGLMRSADKGTTWEEVLFADLPINGAPISDVVALPSGRVYVSRPNGDVFVSEDGTGGSFTQVPATALPIGGSIRTVLATSATDEDHVWVMAIKNDHCLNGIYESKNGGKTWTLRLQDHDDFEPMSNSEYCQGHYDAAFAVSPIDDELWFIGGVQLWRFDGNLTRCATESGSPPFQDISSVYVHADKHYFYFSPNNPNRFYVTSDGGISVTEDRGLTWQTLNKGYYTTQFYSVAFGTGRIQLGGTQDNGTLVVLGANDKDPKMAYEITGGDGLGCAVSQISPLMFTSSQYGSVYRVDASQQNNINPAQLLPSNRGTVFHTEVALWENPKEKTSKDSVYFKVITQEYGIATSNGVVKTYEANVMPVQKSAIILRPTIKVSSGSQTLTVSPTNETVLTSTNGSTGTITFNDDGSFDVLVNFATAPSENSSVLVSFEQRFEANSVVVIESQNLRSGPVKWPFEYRLESDLNPGDSIKVQDPVQSLLATTGTSGDSDPGGGFRILRNPLDFQRNPNEIINIPGVGGSITCFAFTKDGNHLFAGTSSGTIYRVSGLHNLYYSSVEAEMNAMLAQLTVSTFSSGFGGGGVTDICLDPNDNNKLLVCGGGYNSPDRVKYSTNALAATVTFKNVHANLPAVPVYACQIDRKNSNMALLGTEFGLWATDNLGNDIPVWSDENDELSYVPVYTIDQQPYPWESSTIGWTGSYFIGTYGRGLWQTTDLVGVKEVAPLDVPKGALSGLRVFPNPMQGEGNIAFNASFDGKVTVTIYDLQGRQVRSFQERVARGQNNISISTYGIKSGNYIATVEAGGSREMAKIMVMR